MIRCSGVTVALGLAQRQFCCSNFQFCNSHVALNLDGCDRLFSLHLFRTLPVGYIHGCLLVCVPSHLHFRVLWVLRHRQHYYHRRGLLEKARFSHFQSVTSSGAFWLCFSTFDCRALSPPSLSVWSDA